MDMKTDIQHKKTMVRNCIIATFTEHELDNQIEKQVQFPKIIYTIRIKLNVTAIDLAERSKIAFEYLNDFENNNKSTPSKSVITNTLSQSSLMIKRSVVKC